MDKEEQQKHVFSAIVESMISCGVDKSESLDILTSAALQAFTLISEMSGRNTLRDLYGLRRQLTELINIYKKGLK